MRRWYSWRSRLALYEVPPGTAEQVRYAKALLRSNGAVAIEDWDGHVGAMTLLRARLRNLQRELPTKKQLVTEIHRLCKRPGFDLGRVHCSVERTYRFVWIDPMTISCALDGMRFKPYHATPAGLAAMGRRIVNEQGDPGGLARLFGDPRAGHSGIVLWSVPGPLGPVRPISVNGLHRSVVLQSLHLPVALAEMRQWEPPYRYRVSPDDDWEAVWAFFQRLDDQGAIRLSPRPVVEISVGGQSYGRDIRVADAPAPWLLGDESRARTALAAYEELKGRRVRRIGRMDTADLRYPSRRRVRRPPGSGTATPSIGPSA